MRLSTQVQEFPMGSCRQTLDHSTSALTGELQPLCTSKKAVPAQLVAGSQSKENIMKIDLDQIIHDQAGNPVLQSAEGDKPATLGFIAMSALFATVPGDERLEGGRKAEIGNLGLLLYRGGKLDLTPEQRVLIRERVGVVCQPLIVARVFALLD